MPEAEFRVTGVTQQAAWLARTIPPVEEVRPGVWSIPIDFAHAPIRYTFCYVVVAPDGRAVVIDPGGESALGREQLLAGLAVAGVAPTAIAGVVSTHVHLDHIGMVDFAAELGGGWIGYHERDHDIVLRYGRGDAAETDRGWLRGCGAPESAIERVVVDEEGFMRMAGAPAPTLAVEDGDLLPIDGVALRVVWTPGHTPGHICIVDETHGLVFSGDHVLPRITPNVGMTSTGMRHGTLSDYYASLERIAEWDDAEVCPAHEYRFTGLRVRAEDLASHHRERSDAIVDAVADEARTIWDIAASTPWARPWESFDGVNLRAALGETSAHVDHLLAAGRLEAVGADPLRVRAVASAPAQAGVPSSTPRR